jgi:hypothetical protein
VPLLVVSAWTGDPNHSGAPWVSGACGGTGQPSCPNFGPPTNPHEFVHDFGSILAFTEWNFNLPRIAPPLYADANAPKSWVATLRCWISSS